MNQAKSTIEKALWINRNPQVYGTFAEIGAGQEVARYFFQAGQASQTIAKTISAYDMIYSDEIYGKEKSGRYVCESRVLKMLDKEFNLLIKRLGPTRGDRTTFFALANTVATSGGKKRYSHGWMGIRFQTRPQGPANDIVIHLRLQDKYRLMQQEALGVLGTNLVDAAFEKLNQPEDFVDALVENLKQGQVSIDFLRFSGPDLAHFNNHLINLELVTKSLAEAVLFGPDQSILNISDECFNKSILLQRGIFRPVTTTHLDVLDKGMKHFKKEYKKDPLVLYELTMKSLAPDGNINEKDFLDRVRSLCALGKHVLVSGFDLYYQLKQSLAQYTEEPLIIICGASHLDRLFHEEYYRHLEGGLLEGLAKLFDHKTKMYIYPHKTETTCMTTRSFFPPTKYLKIYQYFLETQNIVDISGCDETKDYLHSDYVRDLILAKDPHWKDCVPEVVRELIEKENLFGLLK